MMYLELDRADARGRQELATDLRRVLDDVALAVRDWQALQSRMREDAAPIARCGRRGAARLVRRRRDDPARLSCRKAVRGAVRRARHLQHPGRADRRGRMPRRDALFRAGRGHAADGQGRAQARPSIAAFRSTSSSCRSARSRRSSASASMPGCGPARHCAPRPKRCRCCAERSQQLDKDFGFDRRAIGQGAAPRDRLAAARLLITDRLRQPARAGDDRDVARRPAAPGAAPGAQHPQGPAVQLRLAAARGARRTRAARRSPCCSRTRSGATITSWSVELGDSDLALIRYTQYIDAEDAPSRRDALNAAVVEMVRGWAPAVEADLIELAGAARATRLALTYLARSPTAIAPAPHRRRVRPTSCGCANCPTTTARQVRISRARRRCAAPAQLKMYRKGGLIPLSEAVPVLRELRLPGDRRNADGADWRQRLHP